MIWRQGLLGLIGFSSGFLVAGGVVALMVGLGILTRFIGISGTAASVRRYEDGIFLGAVAGNAVTVFSLRLVTDPWLLAAAGIFMGVFVGGWIMALAEVVNVFPVFSRRFGITGGTGCIVAALAAGKIMGSLLCFWMGWGLL